jgi:hypothetical protein
MILAVLCYVAVVWLLALNAWLLLRAVVKRRRDRRTDSNMRATLDEIRGLPERKPSKRM